MSWRVLKYFFQIFLLLVLLPINPAQADDSCNPVVKPSASETTVAQKLAGLAEKYNFSLSFPKGMDKPVRIDDTMELEQLIKLLTTDMNTVLLHKKVAGCAEPILTELTVMPVGEETEFISVAQRPVTPPVEYIYIENMEKYVTEVLMRERKAEMDKMTPEQKAEFKAVKKRLRNDSKDEIKQSKEKKRIEKKSKNKAPDGTKSISAETKVEVSQSINKSE